MVARVQDLHKFRQPGTKGAFTNAMSRAVNGVSVVTTDGPHGRFGLTVSSMTSVSASPPMLLICVNRQSVAHDAIRDNERFAVNVLAAGQRDIADRFAGHGDGRDRFRFDPQHWDTGMSSPRLIDAAAHFECALVSAMTFGSHSVLVAQVTGSNAGDDAPLLYTGRDYGRPIELN
jgi:flavin reductase